MKIAIIHDDLMRRGGAEKVVLSFHKAFPDAPIYTLCYQRDLTYSEFQNATIKTSWFQYLAKTENQMKRFFFPLGIIAMKQLAVNGFDVALMSTTFCAKYVQISKGTTIITYCHNPFRLAWEPYSYPSIANSVGVKKMMYNLVIKLLRNIDKASTKKVSFFIANSNTVSERIKQFYGVKTNIPVINPPVDITNFKPADSKGKYYLVVSRFEPYKRVDLSIKVFNELNLPLIIVGNGSLAEDLKVQAKENILFKSGVSQAELADLYVGCKALIFPQLEDYGITPLEANACGRPVIAYGKGGVTETMIPYNASDGNASQATALFFNNQTSKDLKTAVLLCEKLEFDPDFIRKNAEKFDEQIFIKNIKCFISDKYQTL